MAALVMRTARFEKSVSTPELEPVSYTHLKDYSKSVAPKWQHAGAHFVENGAKGKHICSKIEVFAADLFGRHVGNRAQRCAGTGQMLSLIHI